MNEIVIHSGTYQIQRVFLGKQSVSDLIQNRICGQLPQILPLTKTAAGPYNDSGDCTVVRRYNGQ